MSSSYERSNCVAALGNFVEELRFEGVGNLLLNISYSRN